MSLKPLHDLTDLQLEVLHVIWSREEATVIDVHDALVERTGLARKTIGTILMRMEKQGVLTHRVDGREFVYRARVTRGEVGRATVRNVLDRLFRGSVPALVNHALQADEIAPDDVERIRALLDHRAREGGEQ